MYLRTYDSVTEALADIAEHIEWYNLKRGYNSLTGMAPDEAYWKQFPKLKVAA